MFNKYIYYLNLNKYFLNYSFIIHSKNRRSIDVNGNFIGRMQYIYEY